MGYPYLEDPENTTAPDQMERANQALSNRFAANPVEPRAPAPTIIADAANAGGFGVQPGTDLNSTPPSYPGPNLGGRLSDMIDSRTAALQAERGVIVTPAATSPRPAASSGPITGAVMKAGEFSDARYESQRPGATAAAPAAPAAEQGPIGIARGATMPAVMRGTPDPYNPPRTVESMRRELDLRNAAEEKSLMESRSANLRMTAQMSNDQARDIALGNAARGMAAQQMSLTNRDKYGGLEKDYTAQIAALRGGIGQRTVPDEYKGTPIADQVAIGEAMNRQGVGEDLTRRSISEQLKAGQDIESGKTTESINKLKLQQAQQMSGIHTKLLDPKTTPEEHRRMSDVLLSMLGKDKPEEFIVTPIRSESRVDPATGAIIPGEQNVAVTDKRSGKTEIHSAAALASGNSAAPPQNAIDYLKKNPNTAAMFDAKYGKGAAAKLLGTK